VAEEKDPEQLIAEALRAHVVRTPLPESETQPTGPTLGGAYGLLSGTDAWAPRPPADDEPPTVAAPAMSSPTTKIDSRPPVGAVWILLFALVLGLAAGAVIGLVTLL
jgi:hypothetical protein